MDPLAGYANYIGNSLVGFAFFAAAHNFLIPLLYRFLDVFLMGGQDGSPWRVSFLLYAFLRKVQIIFSKGLDMGK
jgi:hypothetical protein